MNRLITGCMLVLVLLISAAPAEENNEAEDAIKQLEEKYDKLSERIENMADLMLQMVQKLTEAQKVSKNILKIMKENKAVYTEPEKTKIGLVIKSCDSIIMENDETMYNCKIKFDKK